MPPANEPISSLAGAPPMQSLPSPFRGRAPRSILILRGGALGDFVLTLPALSLLRSVFATSRIEVIAHPRIASLAAPPYVQAITSIEKAALAAFFSPNAALDTGMAAYIGQFELVVSYLHDPDGVFESNVRACGVPHFLSAYRPPTQRHAAEEWALPLRELGLSLQNPSSQIHVVDSEYAEARLHLHVPAQALCIAIHPGSGSPKKNWPPEKWGDLASFFLKTLPRVHLLFVGGEADMAQKAYLQSRFSAETGRIRFAWDQPPRHLAALLKACHFFTGHDSGVSHIAAAVGTRCLLLFGPTNPAIWAPAGAHVHVLRSSDGSLESISLSAVKEACIGMLGQFQPIQSLSG